MLTELSIMKNLEAPSATQMLSIWDRLEILLHRLSIANLHRDVFSVEQTDHDIENLMHSRFKEICANVGQNYSFGPTPDAAWPSRLHAYVPGGQFGPHFIPLQPHLQSHDPLQQRVTPLDDAVHHLLAALPSIFHSGRLYMQPRAHLLKLFLFAMSHQPFSESSTCMHIVSLSIF